MNRLTRTYTLISSTWVLEQVLNDVQQGKINLSPIYQRDFVWDVQAQRQFMQNMIYGFPFGSIILNRDDNTDSVMYMECVDGKQRMTAMVDFCNNKFSILIKGEELYYKDLTEAETRKVHNLGVPVYYVYNLSEMDLIKLFLDINAAVPQSTEHMNYVKSLIKG